VNKLAYLGFLGVLSVAGTILNEPALYELYGLVAVNMFFGFHTHEDKEKSHPTKSGKCQKSI